MSNEEDVMSHVIGTEAGQVVARFESWDAASEWREGHARDVFAMPRLQDNDE